jgi:hypothetical protein
MSKPKAGEFLGEGTVKVNESTPGTGGFYVQFPEEPLHAAIEAHDDDPFKTIEECMEFVAESGEEMGRTFNVVDIDGKVHMTGIVTHSGVEEINVDSIRRR